MQLLPGSCVMSVSFGCSVSEKEVYARHTLKRDSTDILERLVAAKMEHIRSYRCVMGNGLLRILFSDSSKHVSNCIHCTLWFSLVTCRIVILNGILALGTGTMLMVGPSQHRS